MKVCSKCKAEKDESLFYKQKAGKDGFDIWCKECKNIYHKNYVSENKDSINANARARHLKDPSKSRIKDKKYYEKNTEKCLKQSKEWAEKNKDKFVTYRKKFYEENKELCAIKSKEYNNKNKDQIRKQKKEYYEKNKEKWKQYRENNRIKNDK